MTNLLYKIYDYIPALEFLIFILTQIILKLYKIFNSFSLLSTILQSCQSEYLNFKLGYPITRNIGIIFIIHALTTLILVIIHFNFVYIFYKDCRPSKTVERQEYCRDLDTYSNGYTLKWKDRIEKRRLGWLSTKCLMDTVVVILTIFLVYQNEFEPTINTILAIVINGKEIVIRLGFSGVSGICGLLGDKVVLRQVLTTLGMLGMVTVAILPLFLTQFQNNNLQIYTRTITGVCEKGVVIEYALLEGSIGSDGYCAEGRCIKFGYDRFLKCGRRIDDVVIGNGTLRDYLIRFPASEGVIGGLGNGNVTVGKSESECGGDVNLPLSRIMSIWGEY